MQIWKLTYEHIREDLFLFAIIAVAVTVTIYDMAAFWYPVWIMSLNLHSSIKAYGAKLLTPSSSGQSPHLKSDSSDFRVPALQICSQWLVLSVRCLVWLSWLWNEGIFLTSLRGREPSFLQDRHPLWNSQDTPWPYLTSKWENGAYCYSYFILQMSTMSLDIKENGLLK